MAGMSYNPALTDRKGRVFSDFDAYPAVLCPALSNKGMPET